MNWYILTRQLCPSTLHHLCFSKLLLKPTYLISWCCDILLSTKGKSNAAINSWSCWTTSTSWFATATHCNPKSSVWLKPTSDFVWSSYCSNKFLICIWKDSQTRFPPQKKIFSNQKKHQSNAATKILALKCFWPKVQIPFPPAPKLSSLPNRSHDDQTTWAPAYPKR